MRLKFNYETKVSETLFLRHANWQDFVMHALLLSKRHCCYRRQAFFNPMLHDSKTAGLFL